MNTPIRVVHEKRKLDGSNLSVIRDLIYPIDQLEIRTEGTRAVDTAEFITNRKYAVVDKDSDSGIAKGDIISIITDDISVEHLVGAWNFYYTTRDESGYNFDFYKTNGSANDIEVETTTYSRNQQKKYLDFNKSAGSQVYMSTPSSSEGNLNIMNFNEGCEIHMWIRTPSAMSGTKQVILDRMDSDYGIQIGVEKSTAHSGTTYHMFWKTKISDSSGNNTVDKTTVGDSDASHANMEVELGTEYFVRLWREDDLSNRKAVFKLSVNNSVNTGYNYTSTSSSLYLDHLTTPSTPQRLTLGYDRINNSDHFTGRLYALRIYNRRFDHDEQTIAYKRNIQPLTMKFSGTVESSDKEDAYARVSCKGWSQVLDMEVNNDLTGSSIITDQLLETTVGNMLTGTNSINTNILTTTGSGQDSSYSNVKHHGKDIKYEFSYNNPNDEDESGGGWKVTSSPYHPRHINKIIPCGKLMEYVRALAILGGREVSSTGTYSHLNGADQFFVHPRKVLIFESSDIDNHTYCSPDQNYMIHDSGTEADSVFNDIHVFSKIKIKTRSYIDVDPNSYNNSNNPLDLGGTFGNGSIATNGQNIVGVRVIWYNNSLQNERYFELDSNWNLVDTKLYVNGNTGGSSARWIVYVDYIDMSNYGNVDGDSSDKDEDDKNNYYFQRNAKSVKDHGLKSLRIYFPQMRDITTSAALSRRILGESALPDPVITVDRPFFSNSMWVGHKIVVTDEAQDIHSMELQVKSIIWKFKRDQGARTLIRCGKHAWNFLDQLNLSSDKINTMFGSGEHSGLAIS